MKTHRFMNLLIVLTLLLAAMNFVSTPEIAQAQDVTIADAGSGGVGNAKLSGEVVLDSLPTFSGSQENLPAGTPEDIGYKSGVSLEELRALKLKVSSTNVAAVPSAGDGPRSIDGGSRTPNTSANFNGLSNLNNLYPSDMALAVGSAYVLQLTNSSMAVYSKTGVIQTGYPKNLKTFLGLPSSAFVFDPRALYDSVKKRYIVVIDQSMGSSTTSKFYVAVSKTSDPRGAWWKYSFNYTPGTTEFGDFPTLGQDAQGIYVCFNAFTSTIGSYAGNKCFLFPKSKMYAGATVNYWYQFGFNVGGTQVDTLQPVNTNGTPRAEFMVNSYNINFGGGQCFSGCTGLVVWAISNPFGFLSGGPNPVFTGTTLSTSTYSLPPGADAPACANCVDTGDTRLSGTAVYNAGSIFASLTTNVNNGTQNVAGIRWFEVTPYLNDGDTVGCTGAFAYKCAYISGVTLKQEGTYYYSGTWSTYFGTLHPDRENNITMVFNTSSADVLPGTAYALRRVTLAANTFHDNGLWLITGSGSVTTGLRWGDYTATAADPSSASKIWFSGMYNYSTNNWKTRIGAAGFFDNFTP